MSDDPIHATCGEPYRICHCEFRCPFCHRMCNGFSTLKAHVEQECGAAKWIVIGPAVVK